MISNRFSKITAIVATALLVTTTFAQAASAPAVATSAVNVRSGPSTSFNRLDTLHAGENVTVLECQSGWCYVDQDGPDGWVSGNYLGPVSTSSGFGSGSSSSSSSSPATSPAHTASGDADAATAAALALLLGVAIVGIAASSGAAAAPAPALPHGPDTCVPGYVWRDAIPGDHVCVVPARRALAANENATASARVIPLTNSCLPGFVWREAYAGDVVCVTPARRTQVLGENVAGPSHRVLP